jgi:antitoxin component YwqK of YwqJK toxin-antitoxin module
LKDDKLEGECLIYYKNGKLDEHLFYKDGFLEGECKVYYNTGEIEKVTYYKKGIDITEQVIAKRELLERIKDL